MTCCQLTQLRCSCLLISYTVIFFLLYFFCCWLLTIQLFRILWTFCEQAVWSDSSVNAVSSSIQDTLSAITRFCNGYGSHTVCAGRSSTGLRRISATRSSKFARRHPVRCHRQFFLECQKARSLDRSCFSFTHTTLFTLHCWPAAALRDLEWRSKIFNNTGRRTADLRVLLSASLYFSKRGAYWDRLCRDVVGRWLSRACTMAKRCILGL